MNKRTTLSITLILALLMGLFTTGMAFASESTEDEVVGIVVEIFEDYLLVDVDGELLEIPFGQNFDPETVKINVGDEVVIKTRPNEDGDLVITELKIQERARDRVQTQDGTLESNFCAVEEVQHPIAAKLEVTYGIPYAEIEGYLCGETHVPLGQIMLALATAELSEDYAFTDFLDGFENIKWGKIWQELDLKGKPGHGVAPGQIKQGADNTPDGGQNAPADPPGNK
jgi:hypothetical protein